MKHHGWTLAAAGGSFVLLAGAFFFQSIGYAPCKMCIWQRYPHAVAIALGVLMFLLPSRTLARLGAFSALFTACIGLYHTGVERKWWEGPSSCSGTGSLEGLSGADLLATDGPRVVMCDVVSWQLLGLSMASWNALLSLALVFVWVQAAKRV